MIKDIFHARDQRGQLLHRITYIMCRLPAASPIRLGVEPLAPARSWCRRDRGAWWAGPSRGSMGGSKAAPEDDDAEPETSSGILGLVDAAEAAEAADGVVSAPARKPALGERAGASLSRAFTKVNKAAAGARVPRLPCLGPPRTDALNGALDVNVGRLALHGAAAAAAARRARRAAPSHTG